MQRAKEVQKSFRTNQIEFHKLQENEIKLVLRQRIKKPISQIALKLNDIKVKIKNIKIINLVEYCFSSVLK